MPKNIKCFFSGQHLKQRIIVFVSITKIVSDFNMKISYLVMICIKDPQMHTQEVVHVQGVRKEHTVQWTHLGLIWWQHIWGAFELIPLGSSGSGTVIRGALEWFSIECQK